MSSQIDYEKTSDYIETSILEICTGVVQKINKTIKKLSFFITQKTTTLLSRAQRENLRQNIKNHYGKATKKLIPTFKRALLQEFNIIFREKASLRRQLYFSKIQRANDEKLKEVQKKQRQLMKLKALRMRVDDYLQKKKTMKKKSQRFWKYAEFLKNKTGQVMKFVKACKKGEYDSKNDKCFINESLIHKNKVRQEMEIVKQKFKSQLNLR